MSRRRGAWSSEERARLRALFPTTPSERLARLLGRTETSVLRQAARMYRRPRRSGKWKPSEERTLREAVGALDVASIALVLARSQADVQSKIDELRRARRRNAWSRREIALLKRVYGSRSPAELEACLSRPAEQIESKARQLCLGKDKAATELRPRARMPRWTAAEVAELRRLYPSRENVDVARALRRSVASVASKASQLGLKKEPAMLRELGRRNVANRYR